MPGVLLFFMLFFFRADLGSSKTEGRYRDCPYTPLPWHIPPPSSTSLTRIIHLIDEPILIYQNHAKCTLGFTLLLYFHGFGQMYNDRYPL